MEAVVCQSCNDVVSLLSTCMARALRPRLLRYICKAPPDQLQQVLSSAIRLAQGDRAAIFVLFLTPRTVEEAVAEFVRSSQVVPTPSVAGVAVLTDVLDHVGANWLLFQLLHKVF